MFGLDSYWEIILGTKKECLIISSDEISFIVHSESCEIFLIKLRGLSLKWDMFKS